MSPLERIEQLFHEGRARAPGAGRSRWLEEQCGADAALLSEVENLLASHDALAERAVGPPPPETAVPTAQFGAYRAVRLLGRGGMSVVYLAQRADGRFEQTVALKIMAGHLAGPEFLRRFEIERQLLAVLSHNHITRLLDGGVSSAGDPYLITEYVEGQTIDRYCDDGRLDIPARVRILLQVCEAVAYAHRNLIVHRDLKPGNILVDGEGTAKLLDFGTAGLAAANDRTLTRDRMLTPRYASPEQLRGERVGVGTDIFSLGVVLYELVTGAWPYGDPASTLTEWSRALGDAPVRPPAAMLTAEAAARRATPLDRLRRALRGDLSAILLKALEHDPARRYESVAQLAGDLRHFLDQRPVAARRQTAWYRAAKFALRHRLGLAAAAAVLLTVAASSTLLYQVHLSQQEKARQVDGLTLIMSEASSMIYGGLADARPDLAHQEAVRLRDSLDRMRRNNPDNPMVWGSLGNAYLQLGQLAWFRYSPSLMDPGMALESYSRARMLFENLDRRNHVPSAFREAIAARLYESELLGETGRGFEAFGEAAQLLRDGEARMRGPVEPEISVLADLAAYYDMLSDRLGTNMEWTAAAKPAWYAPLAALAPYRATDAIATTVYRSVLPSLPASPDYQFTMATVNLQLGRLEHQAGLHEAGSQKLRESLAGYISLGNTNRGFSTKTTAAYVQLSRAAEREGNLAEALRQMGQAIELLEKQFADAPDSLYLKEKLGESRVASARLLSRLGRRREALRDGKLGLGYLSEIARREPAPALTLDLVAQRLLTVEPAELRDANLARAFARRAVRQTASEMPPYLVTLAFAELAAGDEPEGRRTARRAVEGYRRVAEILGPLFDQVKYPEAARRFAEWRRQMAGFPDLR